MVGDGGSSEPRPRYLAPRPRPASRRDSFASKRSVSSRELLLEVRLRLLEQVAELLRHLGVTLDAYAALAERAFRLRAGQCQQRDRRAGQARVRRAVVARRDREASAVGAEEEGERRALDGERHDAAVELARKSLGAARPGDVAVEDRFEALEQHGQ